MSSNSQLLSKHTLWDTELRNRIALAPMSRASAGDDGTPTPNMVEYYRKFAQGEYGLLIAEGAYTDALYAQSYANQPGMVTQAHRDGWKAVVDAVKREGGKIFLQLIHAGAVSQCVETPHAPSSVKPLGKMLQMYGHKQGEYTIPETLSMNDIKAIKQGFAQAAKSAEEVGFDGVEIHCANGYLLDQFLTGYANQRTDRYGGVLENRIRLTCEILRQVQSAASAGFVVGVRLSQAKANNQEYFWSDGGDDAGEIFTAVAEAGADYIHLASEMKGYRYHSYSKDGINLTELARKKTGLPIIANGGLHNVELANTVVSKELADIVAIGKTALMNPDLPKKLAAGADVREFDFDLFKYGVSIEAQERWEKEASSKHANALELPV